MKRIRLNKLTQLKVLMVLDILKKMLSLKFNLGILLQNMREDFKIIKDMESEDQFILMVIFTKDLSKKDRDMEVGQCYIVMEDFIKEIGKMMNSMEGEFTK